MQDIDQLLKLIPGIGVSGVLVVLVYGLLKGWFVTGREHTNLTNLYISLQAALASTQVEIQRLKDRDDSQQKTIEGQAELIDGYRKRIEGLERELHNVTIERDTLRQQITGVGKLP